MSKDRERKREWEEEEAGQEYVEREGKGEKGEGTGWRLFPVE